MFHNYQLKPMLLEEVNEPFNDKNFLYEIKFDGIRALIYVSKNSFKILSRNGTNLTNKYLELKKIQKLVGNHEIIFDGEIIATEGALPSFSLLQKTTPPREQSQAVCLFCPIYFFFPFSRLNTSSSPSPSGASVRPFKLMPLRRAAAMPGWSVSDTRVQTSSTPGWEKA